MTKPLTSLKRSCFYLLSFMFSEAGYNVVNKPLIYTTKKSSDFLSFAFDDSAENVWIAAADMSSKDIEKIVNKTRNAIHETLDIPVHVNAILINPTDKPTQTSKISYEQSQKNINASAKDSYILIFNSLQDADDYLQANKNQFQEDISHFPDALSYYEKIVELLNIKLFDEHK